MARLVGEDNVGCSDRGRLRSTSVSAKSHARAVRVRELAVYHTVVNCSGEIQRSSFIRAPELAPRARPLIPSWSCPLFQAPALRAPLYSTARPLSSSSQGSRSGWDPPCPALSTLWRRRCLSCSASPPTRHASRPPAAPIAGDAHRPGGGSPVSSRRPRGTVPGGSPRVEWAHPPSGDTYPRGLGGCRRHGGCP